MNFRGWSRCLLNSLRAKRRQLSSLQTRNSFVLLCCFWCSHVFHPPARFHCWFLTFSFCSFSRNVEKKKSVKFLIIYFGSSSRFLLPTSFTSTDWIAVNGLVKAAEFCSVEQSVTFENSSRKWKFVYTTKRKFLLLLLHRMLHSFS